MPPVEATTSVEVPLATDGSLIPLTQTKCAQSDGEEIVVCGRRDNERYRLQPLPPLKFEPVSLEQPLVMELAPGVSVGFLGRGFGLRIKF